MTRQETNATPKECCEEMTRIAQETGQYDDPPHDMPPLPDGSVLDGRLKDHEDEVRGYTWALGCSKWVGPCNWCGMKNKVGISSNWWFARVTKPTEESEELPNSITIKADHFEVETKDGELTVRWW